MLALFRVCFEGDQSSGLSLKAGWREDEIVLRGLLTRISFTLFARDLLFGVQPLEILHLSLSRCSLFIKFVHLLSTLTQVPILFIILISSLTLFLSARTLFQVQTPMQSQAFPTIPLSKFHILKNYLSKNLIDLSFAI